MSTAPPLPTLTETKRTLDGREKHFACRVLARHGLSSVVVLFIAPAAMQVHGVDLPAGTITFGHFWSDRPYNVYHWLDGRGQTLGYYFNLADQVVIETEALSWRDLVLDVLVRPGQGPEVLDEHELDELGASLEDRAAAGRALERLLADLPELLPALASSRADLWDAHEPSILAETSRIGAA